ncbi:MAG: HIT domain-containing protein [Deferrisomatales bacterium]
MFTLHPRLEADTRPLGRLALCRVLWMNDAAYPWLVLVPERDGVTELHDLAPDDQAALMREVVLASRAMKEAFGAHKVNVGALGNLVPQLHVHVVARFHTDPAWPGPVWGHAPARPYGPGEAEAAAARVRPLLGPGLSPLQVPPCPSPTSAT